MKASIVLLAGIVFITGCEKAFPPSHADHADSVKVAAPAKKAWHCPMHPQIVKDHAGSCPICGMDLVEILADATSHPAPSMTDSVKAAGKVVKVDPALLQKIGVRTAMVEAGTVGREIRADAEGVADEAAEISVSVRVMGYLETVAAVRSGDRVKAGQILANLFSPELVAAQGDWLAARRSGDSLSARAAYQRLVTLGFPTERLDAVGRGGVAIRIIPLTSPVSGWLKGRAAVRGQAVMAGAELFRIVEGSGVLLEARLPVSEAAQLKTGDAAELTGAGMEKPQSAKVVATLPLVDRASRSATVRLAPLKGSELRIGALYQVRFQARSMTGFVVPQDAVLHSGRRDIVFLALGDGRFQPAEVKLGATSNGKTLVLEGVEAGDEVVVSAQFLLDGEGRLQSALDQMTAGAEAAPAGHGAHK
jgi:membrane fusion protein, copper/silver efflux system